MDPSLSLVTVLSFAGLASTIAAGGLIMRDLFSGFGKQRSAAITVGRLPLARDEKSPSGLTGNVDHWLRRLVLESGIDCTPMAALLLLICSGLTVGGLLFLWHEDEIIGAVGMMVGMLLPLPYFVYRRSKRIREIQGQLPDVLDLLARAVRAGESLDQAIELAGQKSAEPLAKEFRRCSKHLQMGLSLAAAMRALTFRVRLMEMRIFATTLAVHRQTGGNLAMTLERMAVVLRDRLNYRRQLRATTAAGRFSAMLVAAAGPLLFVYMFLFQSEYTGRLLHLPVGQTLLIAAVVLEVIGLIWILRMLRIEY